MKSIGKNEKRIVEYDALRVILIILVVIGHATYYTIGDAVGSIDYNITGNFSYISNVIYTILRSVGGWIYSFHMPLFFFLSGAVFCLKNISYLKFDDLVKNKFVKLIIPYFLVLTLYMLPIKLISGFYDMNNIGSAYMQGLINPGATGGHLWFLATLFWCFIIFYPIAKYLKGKHFLMLGLCLLLMSFSDYFKVINIPLWSNAIHYIFWFGLGYVFNFYRKSINGIMEKNSWLILMITGSISMLAMKFSFLPPFFTIFVGVVFIYCCAFLISNTPVIVNNSVFEYICNHSFGIYLFHDPLNYLILFVSYNFFLNSFVSWIVVILFLFCRIIGIIYIACIIDKIITAIKCMLMKINVKNFLIKFAILSILLVISVYVFVLPNL